MNEIVLDLTNANHVIARAETSKRGLNCELIIADELTKLRVKIKEPDLQEVHDMITATTGYPTYSELEDALTELKRQNENLEDTIERLKERCK